MVHRLRRPLLGGPTIEAPGLVKISWYSHQGRAKLQRRVLITIYRIEKVVRGIQDTIRKRSLTI